MKNFRHIATVIIFLFSIPGTSLSETELSEQPGSADTFYVIRVEGTVQLRNAKAPLKRDDIIRGVTDESEIIFRPSDASAILISPRKGRFVLRSEKPDKLTRMREIICFLKNALLPSSKGISTRTAMINQEQMKEEVSLVISILRSYHKKEDEIRKEALGFLTDFYYDKENADKAERWLNRNFSFSEGK
ncbi:hypothetical protein QUF72_08280 [Desulfobacterales bacterium HSG2]|nr:hypothetical protein [Desulfobacterales bacterium HSG2]